jgi:hypothetical protein
MSALTNMNPGQWVLELTGRGGFLVGSRCRNLTLQMSTDIDPVATLDPTKASTPMNEEDYHHQAEIKDHLAQAGIYILCLAI